MINRHIRGTDLEDVDAAKYVIERKNVDSTWKN